MASPSPTLPHDSTEAFQGTAFDVQEVGFDDFSYLSSLGIYGAVPVSEGTKAAREAVPSTVESTSNTPPYSAESKVLFNIPNYAQHNLLDVSEFDFDLPEIDWEAEINDLGTFTLPMGENITDAAGLSHHADSQYVDMLAASDPVAFGMFNECQEPWNAPQPAFMAPLIHQNNPGPRFGDGSRASIAGRRDNQVAITAQGSLVQALPINPFTPLPDLSVTPTRQFHEDRPAWGKISGFSPARPERSVEHPWVRKTGAKSVGGATRTGKINQYRSSDFYVASQRVNSNLWQAKSGTKFEYNKWGELDGTTMTLSVRDMGSFLFENPASLTLWIQTCPADSARRYHTIGSSRCRFKDCPAQIYRNTIGVGIFRVAIDEASQFGHEQRDPHHVAGYMHLYCAERFLDWPAVCARLDVRADERTFATEPNCRWAASLAKFPGIPELAKSFIKYARHDAQHGTKHMEIKFPAYPAHVHPYRAPKEHSRTLTHAMMKAKMDCMKETRKRQLQGRGERASHQNQNLGDLEQAVSDRRARALERKRKYLANHSHTDDDDDDADDDEARLADGDVVVSPRRMAITAHSAEGAHRAQLGPRLPKRARSSGQHPPSVSPNVHTKPNKMAKLLLSYMTDSSNDDRG